MKRLRLIYLLLLLGLSITGLKAQTAFATEDELKKQATKLFDEEEFEEAYPLYSQLTSIYPKDPNYNYRIGVCMLYAIEDKEQPISYLEFASNKPDVDKEVLFYLAKAYHLNYRFDDAIKMYQSYKKVASAAKVEKLQVDHQIEMCKNGKKLLHNLTDLVVIDKKEMSRPDFYRAYDISGIGGKLLLKPDEDQFKSSIDKKKKEKSIIYLASNNNQIYFSSYGEDPDRGKDIFIIRKLPSGEWSKPQTLGYPINTEYDEDFPFLHPNGKVLYFCSKGHNSMGGYDIFKAVLNEETDTWNKPVNMDFPINTPDDDILYVTNEDEKEAFFSSARASATGKTAVYHIKSDRRAIDKAIIKGNLVKNREGQSLNIKITVKDMKDNSILGIFNSKTDGGYFISLPNGGKFLFTVESPDFTTQSEMISLPVQSSFTPLKQEMSYETGTDKLVFKNLFDQTTTEDDAGYLEVLSLIKEKSKMDVNVNDVVVDNAPVPSADNPDSVTPPVAKDTKKPSTLSNDDIIKIAYDDAKDADNEAKEAKEQADIALNLANQKNELAQNKTDEAKKLITNASSITDPIEKQTAIDNANAVNKEADLLNDATITAFNLAKKLDKSASSKQQEADLSLKYAKDLEKAAVKAKNSTDALTKLDDQKQKLETLSQEKTGADDLVNSLKTDSDNKKRELDKAIQTSADIKQEMTDNVTLVATVQADADKTKNEQLKKGLLDQITELKQDNVDKQKELEQNEIKVARLQKEFNGIKNETDLVNTVIDRSKTETNETAAASIAAIDKNKLEQQVNIIKTESSTDTPVAFSNTNTPVKTTIAPNTGDQAIVKVNEKYNGDLTATEKIENVSDRETAKAEVLKKWSEAIDTEVGKQKSDFVSATDPATKAQLANSISDAQKLSEEKQTQAKESLAKAETIKQQEKTIATTTTPTTPVNNEPIENKTTTPVTSPVTPAVVSAVDVEKAIKEDSVAIVKVNEKYDRDIIAAEKMQNPSERETAKADVLKKWSEAIDMEVGKQKQNFVNVSDPQTKALLANKISDAQKLSEEKQVQAKESLTKAETFKQQEKPLAVNPLTTAIPEPTDTTNENSIVKDEETGSEKQFVYTAAYAKEQAVQANAITKQADELQAQSNELKTKAESLTDVNDKNVAYSQADELNKQSENKKIEAATVMATANKTEYFTNESQLAQLARSTLNNTNDEITVAEIMKDEAGIYFDKAQKLRAEAATTDSYYSKETTLQEAYANEMVALEKQKKAAAIYKKYTGGNLAVNNTNPANSVSAVKTTPVTPINTNPVTPEPVVTNNTPAASIPPVANNIPAASDTTKKNEPTTTALSNPADKVKDPNDTMYLYSNPPLVRDSTTDNFKEPQPSTPNVIPVVTPPVTPANTVQDNAIVKTNVTTQPVQSSPISLSDKEKFERKPVPVYSAAKPIPVNEKLPEGLIFKVQIGAFRNPIPQDLFKGMTPITGETTPQGFTRYTAGIFVKFATADKVKNEIRDLGYKDAFVVAFLNGKRIPFTEALTMAGIDPSTIQAPTTANVTTPVAVNTSQPNTITQPLNIETTAPAENVSTVNGLFYTVQVGVYSQPVAAAKLFNVKPLYSETTPDGVLRYTSGIYNNVPRAVEAKNMIVDVGIKDAFVTAYNNGKRISMTEAAVLEKQGGSVFSTAASVNALPKFAAGTSSPAPRTTPQTTNNQQPTTNNQQPTTNNQQPVTNNQLKNTLEQNNPMPIDSGVVFKVQIGAFKDEVPIDIANKFLQIAGKGIKNYKNENGLTIYTVGVYKAYDDANKTKTEVVAAGVIDAFVIAYSDGKKISIDEANKLINK